MSRQIPERSLPIPTAWCWPVPTCIIVSSRLYARQGRWQEVVEIIKLRWGRWVLAGYPTAWENWNVDFPDGSECHGFSAHPRFHLAEIARETGAL